jgi:hypothetical protein
MRNYFCLGNFLRILEVLTYLEIQIKSKENGKCYYAHGPTPTVTVRPARLGVPSPLGLSAQGQGAREL